MADSNTQNISNISIEGTSNISDPNSSGENLNSIYFSQLESETENIHDYESEELTFHTIEGYSSEDQDNEIDSQSDCSKLSRKSFATKAVIFNSTMIENTIDSALGKVELCEGTSTNLSEISIDEYEIQSDKGKSIEDKRKSLERRRVEDAEEENSSIVNEETKPEKSHKKNIVDDVQENGTLCSVQPIARRGRKRKDEAKEEHVPLVDEETKPKNEETKTTNDKIEEQPILRRGRSRKKDVQEKETVSSAQSTSGRGPAPQPPASRRRNPPTELVIPGEFCGVPVPHEDLIQHETGYRPDLARFNPRRRSPEPDDYFIAPTPSSPEVELLCEFCGDMIPASQLLGHQASAEVEEDGASPVKRGRGRPKGTTKKKIPSKPKANATGRRRGRPKKKADESKDSEE